MLSKNDIASLFFLFLLSGILNEEFNTVGTCGIAVFGFIISYHLQKVLYSSNDIELLIDVQSASHYMGGGLAFIKGVFRWFKQTHSSFDIILIG